MTTAMGAQTWAVPPINTAKFRVGDCVVHCKSGTYYRIMALAFIEATLTPAYVYTQQDGMVTWVRPRAEMEDGRFELVDGSPLECRCLGAVLERTPENTCTACLARGR